MDIAHMSLTDAKDALMRVWNRDRRSKQELKHDRQEMVYRGVAQLTAIGTGVTVGAMRGLWGDASTGDVEIPGIGIDVEVAAGVLLGAPAVFGAFGEGSDVANTISSTLVAIVAARETERLVRASAK